MCHGQSANSCKHVEYGKIKAKSTRKTLSIAGESFWDHDEVEVFRTENISEVETEHNYIQSVVHVEGNWPAKPELSKST